MRVLTALLVLAALVSFASPADAGRWAAGDQTLPELDRLVADVEKAITKAAIRAPGHKPGAEIKAVVVCSEGGCRPEIGSTSLEGEDLTVAATWLKKWILPVTTPGLAVPVRVWWDKPRKGEKKEKLKPGDQPTRPPPGLFWAVGFAPSATGPVALEEVLRAERLVFKAATASCPDEVGQLKSGSGTTQFWHLDVTGAGGITAVPQDLYVPPPDPKELKKAKAKEAAGGAAGGAALLGLEAPEAPVEVPADEEAGEAEPPREWTPLETCVAAMLAGARVKSAGGDEVTRVDSLPVSVVP
jgi:hypothetical protein